MFRHSRFDLPSVLRRLPTEWVWLPSSQKTFFPKGVDSFLPMCPPSVYFLVPSFPSLSPKSPTSCTVRDRRSFSLLRHLDLHLVPPTPSSCTLYHYHSLTWPFSRPLVFYILVYVAHKDVLLTYCLLPKTIKGVLWQCSYPFKKATSRCVVHKTWDTQCAIVRGKRI